ncbi:MAG: helix-turn-helix domain-containing protein [Phycisphaerales bacterium]|nr:helix-turn-helix domain-containing protein [Phycisphaerales bacterium]
MSAHASNVAHRTGAQAPAGKRASAPAHPISVSHAIRRRRAELGMTLDRLSRAVGVGRAYLSMIENGRRHVRAESLLERIERALLLPHGALLWAVRLEKTPDEVRRRLALAEHRCAAQRQLAAELATFADDLLIPGSARTLTESCRARLRTLAAELQTPGASASSAPANDSLEIPILESIDALQQMLDRPGIPPTPPTPTTPTTPTFAKASLHLPGWSDPAGFALRIDGDAMLPQYRAGDLVIFSPASTPAAGQDCIAKIRARRAWIFGRIYMEADVQGNPIARIQPLNIAHAPRLIPAQDVRAVISAIYHIRACSRPHDPPSLA